MKSKITKVATGIFIACCVYLIIIIFMQSFFAGVLTLGLISGAYLFMQWIRGNGT